MKTSELKQLIKEAVREAIQDELKDILLEAVKSTKTIVRESYTPQPETPKPTFTQPTMDMRQKYMDTLGETALGFTTRDIPFSPAGVDPVNGSLGNGELSMDQITRLLNTK
jgi:hypothetical protein